MKKFDLVEVDQWLITPYDHPFFRLNKTTIIYTWITLAILAAILIILRYYLHKKESTVRFLSLSFAQFFIDLMEQTHSFTFNNFVFITTIFSFILACNLVSIIPWMEEPTTDLNTTLSLGLVSFLYTQTSEIRKNGLWAYIKGYFSPFFLMFPLNIIGQFATIVSISFRLFGNIFGGSIISTIYFHAIQGNLILELLGIVSGLNLIITIFFGIFEGCLQAFVFAMLAQTYLSLALQEEGGH